MEGRQGTDSLEGTWMSHYDGFSINKNVFTQYFDTSKSIAYSGAIIGKPNFKASSGSFTYKITDPGLYGMTMNNYYVAFWEDFSGLSVKQAGSPYKDDGNNNGFATQAEAEDEYTLDNGYYSMLSLSEYIRE
jgi:hypothetical protein